MWNKLRDNVKRLLFKCLRVFTFTRLETSTDICLQSWQWAALDVECWRGVPGRWFDLPRLLFHLENMVSKEASLRDMVF